MHTSIPITVLFVGLFALIQVPLTVMGIPSWALWAGGASLLVGRLMHAAILITKGWGNPRAIGMILTFVPMIGFGVWSVYRGLA